jgi:hypothetical protein
VDVGDEGAQATAEAPKWRDEAVGSSLAMVGAKFRHGISS